MIDIINQYLNYITFGKSVRQWLGRPGFNPWSSHTKTQKMVLDASLLHTQYQGLSGAIQGKERHHPLHLGAVAIEKEAFGSPLTNVTNFTFTY